MPIQRNPWLQALIILSVIGVGLYVLGQLWDLAVHFGDIIILFFLAWLLAFILLPLTRALEVRLRFSRALAAAAVYAVLLVCLATFFILAIPLLIDQIAQLAAQLPTLAGTVPGRVEQLQQAFDQYSVPVDLQSFVGPSLSQQAAQFGSRIVDNSVAVASEVANDVFRFTLILILSFYFVLDGDRFLARFQAAVPARFADDVNLVIVGIDRSFGGFLRGTAIQMAFMAVGTALIMAVSGLRYALLASVFAGIVMVVPFVGPPLALALPMVIAISSNLPTTELILVVVALALLQVLILNVIAPAVMSESVGIHPLLVFLGLLVGMKQAGLAGAIFGVPVAAVLFGAARVLLRRWAVVEDHHWDTAAVAKPAVPSDDVEVAEPRVRVERFGPHLGSAISRLFQSRSS